MAAGIIQGTVTTTSGETIEQSWLVDNTGAPTKWWNLSHLVKGDGTLDNTLADLITSLAAKGTPGSASADVITIQGIASMTAVKVDGSGVTQPISNTPLTNFGAGEYETVAASQTAQALGASGATGDYISGLLVVPATTSPGNVLLLDNATSITVFTGGASSVSNLVPFFIPLGMISVSGAWKVTTGANVSVIGVGNFT